MFAFNQIISEAKRKVETYDTKNTKKSPQQSFEFIKSGEVFLLLKNKKPTNNVFVMNHDPSSQRYSFEEDTEENLDHFFECIRTSSKENQEVIQAIQHLESLKSFVSRHELCKWTKDGNEYVNLLRLIFGPIYHDSKNGKDELFQAKTQKVSFVNVKSFAPQRRWDELRRVKQNYYTKTFQKSFFLDKPNQKKKLNDFFDFHMIKNEPVPQPDETNKAYEIRQELIYPTLQLSSLTKTLDKLQKGFMVKDWSQGDMDNLKALNIKLPERVRAVESEFMYNDETKVSDLFVCSIDTTAENTKHMNAFDFDRSIYIKLEDYVQKDTNESLLFNDNSYLSQEYIELCDRMMKCEMLTSTSFRTIWTLLCIQLLYDPAMNRADTWSKLLTAWDESETMHYTSRIVRLCAPFMEQPFFGFSEENEIDEAILMSTHLTPTICKMSEDLKKYSKSLLEHFPKNDDIQPTEITFNYVSKETTIGTNSVETDISDQCLENESVIHPSRSSKNDNE